MGKIGPGHPVRSQTSEVIVNVKKYFDKELLEERPGSPYPQVTRRVSEATGLGLKRVQSICRDAEIAAATGNVFPKETPGKKRPRGKPVTDLDNFALTAIRRRIHRFYLEGELPTVGKLLRTLKEERDTDEDPDDPVIFNGCEESLRQVLKKHLGFRFVKIDRRTHFLERSDVVALRHEFLRKVRNIDFDNIFFLDETWVNENYTVSKCWQSSDHPGLSVPLGKGKRLILLHAGSSKGFVPNCLLLFRSKSGKADYHDDMNAKCFTEWFQNVFVQSIPQGSTIVMDNAPYHSVQLQKAPTSNDRKKTMQDWLTSKNISFDPALLKAELYELVKRHKARKRIYEIDEIAAAAPYFHKVIRLPPYHCQFNAIERVWADTKRYVAVRNSTFKLADVEKLTREAVESITPETWKKHVDHVKRDVDEYWIKDGLIETSIEPLIINIGPEESDSENDTASNSDGGCDTEEYTDFERSFQLLDY